MLKKILFVVLSAIPFFVGTPFSLAQAVDAGGTIQQTAVSAAPYIRPPLSNLTEAPLPLMTSSDQIVGIYGNILYPQDRERIQQQKLYEWIEAYAKDANTPFPLSQEEMNEISLFILERFPVGILPRYFAHRVQHHLTSGQPLEVALKDAKQETLNRAKLYKKMVQKIPQWEGRCEILIAKLTESANQVKRMIHHKTKIIRNDPDPGLASILEKTSHPLIAPPFTWEMRTQVLKQMVEKVLAASPDSPYFFALQEVTPQALDDLKKTFADRNLQWISFNNISEKETLPPSREEVFGEATAFTSTIALSPDLEILKVELGDLPNASGSVRKILGVRVRNTHSHQTFNLFTTHTDHQIQNDIYARTAVKVHAFATQFFQDDPEGGRFVFGGDLNAFDGLGADQYIEKFHTLFGNSQDFRETDYYAPHLIAWTTFIGHKEDEFAAKITEEGVVEPNGLDHIIVGNGVSLESAAREALVYNPSGHLLDYDTEREEYIENLRKRITFSDHFFNIVRFK